MCPENRRNGGWPGSICLMVDKPKISQRYRSLRVHSPSMAGTSGRIIARLTRPLHFRRPTSLEADDTLMRPVQVKVNDKMQKNYVYWRTKTMGRYFRPGFKPDLTPKQMLELGVFGGKYMTDCRREFPASWFKKANLSSDRDRASLNYFGVNASQPLETWRKKGWI